MRRTLTFGLLAVLLLAALIALGGPAKLESVASSVLGGHLRAARSQLAGMGAWEVVAVVTLVLAHTVLPFPTEIVAAAAGFSLGFWLALPVLLASLLISALLAYALGRRLGRPLLARLFGRHRLDRLELAVEQAGAPALLALRLFPLVPFSPVGVACGVCRVPLRRYVWTTAIGILPELAIVTYLGQRLQSPHLGDPAVWAPLAGTLALLVIAPPLLRRRRSA